MSVQFLSLCVSITTFLAGINWTIRQKCVYTFRTFDLNCYSNLIQATQPSSEMAAETHRTIAKQWLKHAEELRTDSIYSTLLSMHLFLSIAMFSVSLVVSVLADVPYWYLPFSLGSLFFLASALMMILRYQYAKCYWFEKLSWKLVERTFPPLLYHLRAWRDVQDLIDTDTELRSYMQNLPAHQVLKRLFSYSSSNSIKRNQ